MCPHAKHHISYLWFHSYPDGYAWVGDSSGPVRHLRWHFSIVISNLRQLTFTVEACF